MKPSSFNPIRALLAVAFIFSLFGSIAVQAQTTDTSIEVSEFVESAPVMVSVTSSTDDASIQAIPEGATIALVAHYWRDTQSIQLRVAVLDAPQTFTDTLKFELWMTDAKGVVINSTRSAGTGTIYPTDSLDQGANTSNPGNAMTNKINAPVVAGNTIHARGQISDGTILTGIDFTIARETQVRLTISQNGCYVRGHYIVDPYLVFQFNQDAPQSPEHLTDAMGNTKAYTLPTTIQTSVVTLRAYSDSALTNLIGAVQSTVTNPCYVPATPEPSPSPSPSPTTPPVQPICTDLQLEQGFKVVNGKCIFRVFMPLGGKAARDADPNPSPTPAPCVATTFIVSWTDDAGILRTATPSDTRFYEFEPRETFTVTASCSSLWILENFGGPESKGNIPSWFTLVTRADGSIYWQGNGPQTWTFTLDNGGDYKAIRLGPNGPRVMLRGFPN